MTSNKLELNKKLYKSFLEDMKTSKISNSAKRYIIEHNLLKEILVQLKEAEIQDEVQEYENRLKSVNYKLENEFCVKVDN